MHVDEVNDVAYTPFPMQVLERFAATCQEVKRRIGAEMRDLEAQTPATITHPTSRPGTRVGRLIGGLSGDTKETHVRELATLTPKENARLQTLKSDLGSDPAKAARQVGALKTRLENATKSVEILEAAVGAERAKRLNELYQAYQTARTAAAAAADSLFAAEPLPNVGSEVWRALWEAARNYSEQEAYPSLSFPATGDGARCVLCHQELDAEAGQRLGKFESFVRDETKRKEEDAQAAYQAALEEMERADIATNDVPALVALVRDELGDEGLAKQVRRAALSAKCRLKAILKSHRADDAAKTIPDAEAWPSEPIAAHITALSDRINALLAEEESDNRKKMRAEFEELSDREWLAVVQEDVVAEIGRRNRRSALDQALKDTATNRITAKSGEIAEQLVTNALRARFSKEVDKLGVAGLAVELRKEKTSYGVPRFRVSLIRKPDAGVGDVLSEGEHRCVALAAFLAELATTEGRSAIVFDDPVSSLDHLRREAVAERLADEGQHRQVIVFTHDIAFLFLLDQACREKGTHIAFRSVSRGEEFAGFCQQDPPARAQPVERVIEGMQRQLDNEKFLYENGDNAGWEKTVDALQKRLRSTWERAVEEALGYVVKRLSNKVDTKGLSKVTALTMDDCIEMREAYGRCSIPLHSSADSLNPPPPTPQAIQDEITALRNWVDDIKQRQNKIDLL